MKNMPKHFDRNDPSEYYRFDDDAKELLVQRHNTPSPWMNYLSNGTFHTMISQAGGACAFYKSPQIWRINRYRFYNLPTDRSGIYCYIKDETDGNYWCPTAEPAECKPEEWEAAHGLGYTRFNAARNGIEARLNYFIGEEDALVCNLHLKNNSPETRKLTLFAYVEFGMMEYLREQSWYCYNKHQLSVDFDDEAQSIIYNYDVEMQPRPNDTPRIFFAADRKLKGFDGDRDEFIGSYRSETNPYAIENGGCTNSTLKGGDPCGALEIELTLSPGQEAETNVFLGAAMDLAEVRKTLATCRESGFASTSFDQVKRGWGDALSRFQCLLPDADAQRQVNIWNPYQAQRNFLFSRNISFYATGTFRGVGFRDTSQDAIAHASANTEETRDKLRLLLAQQYKDGHANHYFFPEERSDPVTRLHSDNHIWPILAVYQLVMEEGVLDFLYEPVAYYDGGEAAVYEHLKQSIAFTRANMGANGFPLMLTSDWNDMLYKVCREGKGESIWMAMFLGYALPKFSELARLLDDSAYAEELDAFWAELKESIDTRAWDGRWYRRAIMDNGEFLGTDSMDEAKIWLNAQSWSVLSGMAEEGRARTAMDSVAESLDTPLGIKMLCPPIVSYPTPEDPLSHYHPGCGENGSVFCHANTWAIMAECMLGNGDRAWKYYRQLIPHNAMSKAGAWRYKAEPHVYASNIFGPDSDKFGLANVSWLTGTAAWMNIVATQYILGIRPSWKGLIIDPCLPFDWEELNLVRKFRGVEFRIAVHKAKGPHGPVQEMTVDGKQINGNMVPIVSGNAAMNVDLFLPVRDSMKTGPEIMQGLLVQEER
jgi:cellobiose phosphorylase